MKTRKLGVAVVAALAMSLIGGPALARGPGARGHGGGMKDPQRFERSLDRRIDVLLDKVQATADQRQKILAIKDRLLSKRAAPGERGDLRRQLAAEWTAEQLDAKALHARIDRRSEEAKRFKHEVVDALVEVHQLLTPEQRAQVAAELKLSRHHRGRNR